MPGCVVCKGYILGAGVRFISGLPSDARIIIIIILQYLGLTDGWVVRVLKY